MEKFQTFTGIVVPLDRVNIDTDAIIPKQFLKSIKRTGFGPNLFDEWRYLDTGEPGKDSSNRPLNKNFVLNQKQNATSNRIGCSASKKVLFIMLDQLLTNQNKANHLLLV